MAADRPFFMINEPKTIGFLIYPQAHSYQVSSKSDEKNEVCSAKMSYFTIQNGRRSAIFHDKPTENNRVLNLPPRHILTKFHQNQTKNEVCSAVTGQKCHISQFKMSADRPFFMINKPKTIGTLIYPQAHSDQVS